MFKIGSLPATNIRSLGRSPNQSWSASAKALFAHAIAALSPLIDQVRLADARPSTPIFATRRRANSCTQTETLELKLAAAARAIAKQYTEEGQKAAQAEVACIFVRPEHMKAMADACSVGNFVASVRAAGEWTLQKLALGAPAKGHDITEKTIKEGSIRNSYPPNQVDAVFNATKDADLLGYVGNWDKKTGRLLGLYMGPDHRLGDRVVDGIYKIDITMLKDEAGGETGEIDMDKLDASLAALRAQENWKSLPFTGDYDLHDLINFCGQRATVPCESPDQFRILKMLNGKIATVDPLRYGKTVVYNLFRHGHQSGYRGFALANKEKVVPEVDRPGFPVAFVHNGKWTIIEDIYSLFVFYTKLNVNMKVSWVSILQEHIRRSSH